ncbi:GNAT family N-acetyltransferase [Aureibaculum conchae]|uniref:GNAT family N-acetyltransferase n=1 Tax=Aureibaculum sp. 2308TA14-22 TaxID=3108392 RepID=UPI003390D0BA
MKQNYSFTKTTNFDALTNLKNEWLTTLTSPQDGMWAFFRDSATHYNILLDDKIIGYAAVDESNQLLQFYITPTFSSDRETIFKEYINEHEVKSGIVGTNNPNYLSLALNFTKDFKINTFLFKNNHEVTLLEKKGTLKECEHKDIARLVTFYNYSMGAPTEWLTDYIGNLIEKKELFSFENDGSIIGTCEIRKNLSASEFADIGMVVSPDYRRNGYGTYLLNKAKNTAIERGKTPICSCEKDNIGSVKSIYNCGFISMHQLLSVNF